MNIRINFSKFVLIIKEEDFLGIEMVPMVKEEKQTGEYVTQIYVNKGDAVAKIFFDDSVTYIILFNGRTQEIHIEGLPSQITRRT